FAIGGGQQKGNIFVTGVGVVTPITYPLTLDNSAGTAAGQGTITFTNVYRGANRTLVLNAGSGGIVFNTGGTGIDTGITGGAITLNGPVRLNADVTLASGTADAIFASTVNSFNATPRALIVNSGGTTSFNGLVGNTNPLSSVATSAAGTTAINGGGI